MRSLVLMAVVGGFALLCRPAYAADATDEEARHRAVDALFTKFDHPGSPGMAVGVFQSGQTIYTRGYGFANLEHNVPITPQTVFYAASLTKQFTAFAIALLAREGKVDLDADIRTYLPYVPDFGKPITVRHLVLHTSGLREDSELARVGGHDSGDVLTQQQIVNLVRHQESLSFEPGTAALYSNTGYVLLAEIVHVASGQTLREFLARRVFQPLGMSHSFILDDASEIIPNRTESYKKGKDDQWHRVLLNQGFFGATNLHTTIEDLGKWAGNFSHPVVGDDALIKQISTLGALNDGTPVNYGFGLWRTKFAGQDVIMHTGSYIGYHLMFVYFPARDFTIVLLANTPFNRFNMVEAIADIYLKGGSGNVSNAPAAITPKPGLLKAAVGHYLSPRGQMITLELDGDRLVWKTADSGAETAIFRADGSIDTGGERFWGYGRPRVDKAGRVTAIEKVIDWMARPSIPYARFEPVQPSPADLNEFSGDYKSSELDITYHFSVENGHLVARSLWFAEPVIFTPTATDRFDSSLGAITFERDKQGKLAGLKLNMDLSYNIALKKRAATELR